MGTYLDSILAVHRRRAASDVRETRALRSEVIELPPTKGFRASLGWEGISVIAEVKRRSPSMGVLSDDLDPSTAAVSYAAGGAAAISVLTDAPHFGGSAEDLADVRRSVSLPILRKDFTVDERDVLDARLMGADAVLLIAAALSDDELASFQDLAHQIGLDTLIEIHDEAELQRALRTGATLIGVNQRDLQTFEVDSERACRLASSIPPEVIAVAESGVRDADDASRLADAGYDAVLVGESIVRAADRAAAVRSLANHPVGARRSAGS